MQTSKLPQSSKSAKQGRAEVDDWQRKLQDQPDIEKQKLILESKIRKMNEDAKLKAEQEKKKKEELRLQKKNESQHKGSQPQSATQANNKPSSKIFNDRDQQSETQDYSNIDRGQPQSFGTIPGEFEDSRGFRG